MTINIPNSANVVPEEGEKELGTTEAGKVDEVTVAKRKRIRARYWLSETATAKEVLEVYKTEEHVRRLLFGQ